MGESLVVITKVKDTAKKFQCATAGDVPDKLGTLVQQLIKAGCERAKSNGRKTLRADDL